jgi:glycosyltransferase involved in cell wall biosynthesis
MGIPIVFTQHTKWDYDIERAVPAKILQKRVERFAYKNLSAADELWAVSRGTGEHLITRGYKGSYMVMPNGTDFPKGSADSISIKQINERFGLLSGVPVLLFVGRMMWYKNLSLIVEALEILHKRSFDYRMIFVGDGEDLPDVKKMVEGKNLAHLIYFAGRVINREELRAFYTRSDLFVFPSVYDNAPLVIREAAACVCPSLVVRNSSASEILEDGVSGFFSNENSEDIANTIQSVISNHMLLKTVAINASEQTYLTWDQVVNNSVTRYREVKERYNKENTNRGYRKNAITNSLGQSDEVTP